MIQKLDSKLGFFLILLFVIPSSSAQTESGCTTGNACYSSDNDFSNVLDWEFENMSITQYDLLNYMGGPSVTFWLLLTKISLEVIDFPNGENEAEIQRTDISINYFNLTASIDLNKSYNHLNKSYNPSGSPVPVSFDCLYNTYSLLFIFPNMININGESQNTFENQVETTPEENYYRNSSFSEIVTHVIISRKIENGIFYERESSVSQNSTSITNTQKREISIEVSSGLLLEYEKFEFIASYNTTTHSQMQLVNGFEKSPNISLTLIEFPIISLSLITMSLIVISLRRIRQKSIKGLVDLF